MINFRQLRKQKQRKRKERYQQKLQKHKEQQFIRRQRSMDESQTSIILATSVKTVTNCNNVLISAANLLFLYKQLCTCKMNPYSCDSLIMADLDHVFYEHNDYFTQHEQSITPSRQHTQQIIQIKLNFCNVIRKIDQLSL